MNEAKADPDREAWRVALAGLLALAVAMGIGRFAFTPLLPMMLHDGVIDLAAGGWLATANYAGYLLGALLCMVLHVSPTRAIKIGLVATVLLTLGMGVWHSPMLWLLLRTLAGIASAGVFVFGSGWCLQRLAQLKASALGGIIYCGPGIGILITGLATSAMVTQHWRAEHGWLLYGLLALILTALVWPTFSGSTAATATPAPAAHGLEPAQVTRQTRGLTLAYALAGFGYIITATFLPVIARQALPGSNWPDLFWPLFGICVSIGALLATRLPTHWDNRLLLAACYLLQACGILIGIVAPSVTGFALGSILLGMPFTAITLFAMRDARRLRGDHARSLMGMLTAAYGVGQIIGPPLATRLVRSSGSFTSSLSVAALALLAGAVLLTAMYRHSRKQAGNVPISGTPAR
ncbi:YbfB/YjiJ family MFS transporter [Collimonas antrihumi]|uniref:YbfB/YjiJ family MFS transporter n=1 Tax=Collimonas antrihumi TaxID=1940615 RepID=UPI001B8C3118|nr:YbfB/YjiJ family MFS transporter [Collimonas antrihumi]